MYQREINDPSTIPIPSAYGPIQTQILPPPFTRAPVLQPPPTVQGAQLPFHAGRGGRLQDNLREGKARLPYTEGRPFRILALQTEHALPGHSSSNEITVTKNKCSSDALWDAAGLRARSATARRGALNAPVPRAGAQGAEPTSTPPPPTKSPANQESHRRPEGSRALLRPFAFVFIFNPARLRSL